MTREFSFTAAGTCGSSFTTVLQLSDGTNNLGWVTNAFGLGPSAAAASYSNANSLVLPGSGTKGDASIYPSTITFPA